MIEEFHKAWRNLSANDFAMLPPLLQHLFVTIGISLAVYILITRCIAPALSKRFPYLSEQVGNSGKIFVLLSIRFGIIIAEHNEIFPSDFHITLHKIVNSLLILTITWFMLNGINLAVVRFSNYLQLRNPESYAMNRLLLDLSKSLIKLVVWCVAGCFVMDKIFGWNISTLLASAGIVGIAVAFAAQNTIANLFGAFAILGGKLFKVGDCVKAGDVEGVVEHFGFRSVRIRALDGYLIDVPNRMIADAQLKNYSNRKFFRENFCFGLVYQTTPEQIRQALGILHGITQEMSCCLMPERPAKFYFTKCNDFSLDIEGTLYFDTNDKNQMLEYKSRFNQLVLERFNAAGLSLAYPTSSIYLEKQNTVADK